MKTKNNVRNDPLCLATWQSVKGLQFGGGTNISSTREDVILKDKSDRENVRNCNESSNINTEEKSSVYWFRNHDMSESDTEITESESGKCFPGKMIKGKIVGINGEKEEKIDHGKERSVTFQDDYQKNKKVQIIQIIIKIIKKQCLQRKRK